MEDGRWKMEDKFLDFNLNDESINYQLKEGAIMTTQNFTELECWKNAHMFVINTYKLTSNFPKSELYGLTSQFRRAAVSIASNIAEGYKRITKKEKIRFYNISQGSIEECHYYIILSEDLGYGNTKDLKDILDITSKKLFNYIKIIKEDMR